LYHGGCKGTKRGKTIVDEMEDGKTGSSGGVLRRDRELKGAIEARNS